MKWIRPLSVLALTLAALPSTAAAEPLPEPDPLVRKLAKDNTAFAVDLYAHLRSKSGNLFFSPASISTALAMALAGARGETASEMRRALHLSLPLPDVHEAYRRLLADWLAPARDEAGETLGNVRDPPSPELIPANQLWPQAKLPLNPDFTALLRTDYRAPVEQLDFVHDPEGARKTINQAVEEQTRKKITELLKPGTIDTTTRLILTNALYFKGAWDAPFDEEQTKEEPFFTEPTQSHPVSMMHQKLITRYAEVDGARVLDLDYASQDPHKAFSLVIVLPNDKGGLAQLESRLDPKALSSWIDGLERHKVDVALPRFQFRTDFELAPLLEAMGMKRAFANDADFSGMTTAEPLRISNVAHGAFVGVDEKGTEAAAASAVVMHRRSASRPPKFHVDHPCLLILRDRITGSILFLGRLADPPLPS